MKRPDLGAARGASKTERVDDEASKADFERQEETAIKTWEQVMKRTAWR